MIQSTLPDFKRGSKFNNISAREMQRMADATEKMHTMTAQGPYLDMVSSNRSCSIGLNQDAVLKHVKQHMVSQTTTTTATVKPETASGLWITANDFNRVSYMGELLESTLSINPNRWSYTPDGAPRDIAGDAEFMYYLSETGLLYEYRASDLALLRVWQADRGISGGTGAVDYPFPRLFPLADDAVAIAANSKMMVIVSLESREPEKILIYDFVGESREPVHRISKATDEIISGSIIPSSSGIRGIAIGDGFMYAATGNGYHFRIDMETLKWTGFIRNEPDTTPTGTAIVDGRFYAANSDTDGVQLVEQRNPNELFVIHDQISYYPDLRGVG